MLIGDRCYPLDPLSEAQNVEDLLREKCIILQLCCRVLVAIAILKPWNGTHCWNLANSSLAHHTTVITHESPGGESNKWIGEDWKVPVYATQTTATI